MRAFVTGSTGLLGNHLCRQLLHAGWSVRALARDAAKARRQLGEADGLEIVLGDLEDIPKFANALTGVDVIFHTAAYFREYFKVGEHDDALQRLNVDASVNLARAGLAAGVRRFVHTSSSGTIRTPEDGRPGTEGDVYEPEALENRYFASKVQADRALGALRAETDLDLVTILPGWMFGPGDAAPTNSGKLVRDALAGALPPVALPGETAVVDARDVAAAMVRAATIAAPGDRFIVAGREASLGTIIRELAVLSGGRPPLFTLPYPLAWSFAATVETIARVRGTDPLVTTLGLRTLNSGHKLSSARAEAGLGTTFRPLAETLADTVAWMRGNAQA